MILRNPKHKSLYTSPKRYHLQTGGRGSGKSFETSTFTSLLTFEEKHTILYTRYTLTSAELSIVPEFEEKIEMLECPDAFIVNKKDITNKQSGSKIWFSGIKTSSGNQTANLKSIKNVTTWVLEEAEELTDETIFNKIDMSVRYKDAQNRVILILNPTTRDHWIWERWFKNSHKLVEIDGIQIPISTHPDVNHIHTTYLDNIDNLDESFLKQIEWIKANDPERYEHEIIGGWRLRPEGAIFSNWKESNFPEDLSYIWGMDFGYSNDPSTLVKIAKHDRNLYLKEYLYQPHLKTSDLIAILKEYVKPNELIIADSAEPRLIDEIYDAGFYIVPAKKGPDSIRNGIARLQNHNLIVHPDSHNLKTELQLYAWHHKRAGIPIDQHNHLIDPIRYGAEELDTGESFYFG